MTIKRVGIVCSGIMGSGLAEVCGKAGFEVVVRSRAQSSADAMVAGLEKSLARQVDKGRMEAGDRDELLGRVSAVTDLSELAECDAWTAEAALTSSAKLPPIASTSGNSKAR